jgi:hypothetical protein
MAIKNGDSDCNIILFKMNGSRSADTLIHRFYCASSLIKGMPKMSQTDILGGPSY